MQNQGIQTLLEAEKEASKIVTKAKQYRIQRLKDARQEAQKEIELLKQQKQQEFLDFEKQYEGSSGAAVKEQEIQTEKELNQLQGMYQKNKAAVISKLLSTVSACNPEVHVNAKSVKS